jgi:hypothetical protein
MTLSVKQKQLSEGKSEWRVIKGIGDKCCKRCQSLGIIFLKLCHFIYPPSFANLRDESK